MNINKYVGAHVSAAGGVENAPLNAQKIGATAFALFTKNQRQWKARPLSRRNVTSFHDNMKKAGILPRHCLPHDSYLINLGHPDEKKRQRSLDAFIDEINRCAMLGLDKLNFHPGSHLNRISEEECIDNVVSSMNAAQEATDHVCLVIENTAGQGSNIGYDFIQIASMISGMNDKSRVGVCIDTCHAFAAGYDIRTRGAYEATMDEFERVIGIEYLKGAHLNDSKRGCGSRIDRHESLGRGEIGLDAFRFIMTDSRFDDMPLILETIEPDLWPQEIEMLRGFAESS